MAREIRGVPAGRGGLTLSDSNYLYVPALFTFFTNGHLAVLVYETLTTRVTAIGGKGSLDEEMPTVTNHHARPHYHTAMAG